MTRIIGADVSWTNVTWTNVVAPTTAHAHVAKYKGGNDNNDDDDDDNGNSSTGDSRLVVSLFYKLCAQVY